MQSYAVCVGMTGSGKTGLCLALLEEAALDGIPAIAIDPKGDIGNLLLTFPGLRAEDFAPWIDAGEAAKHGQEPEAYAATIAERWRAGLRAWDQEPERIARLRAAADFALYTPGSAAGRPIALLRRLSAPAAALRDDAEAVGDRVLAAVSGILALAGIDADPVRRREHILALARARDRVVAGAGCDLGDLIRLVQNPGFGRVGVLDPGDILPGGPPQRPRAPPKQPAGITRLRGVGGGRAARRAAAPVVCGRNAARVGALHRAPVGCGADVLRHAAAVGDRRLDTQAERVLHAACALVRGRGLRVLPADGESAQQAAHADAF